MPALALVHSTNRYYLKVPNWQLETAFFVYTTYGRSAFLYVNCMLLVRSWEVPYATVSKSQSVSLQCEIFTLLVKFLHNFRVFYYEKKEESIGISETWSLKVVVKVCQVREAAGTGLIKTHFRFFLHNSSRRGILYRPRLD